MKFSIVAGFLILSTVLGNVFYFPMAIVNLTLPKLEKLPKPLPPLIKVRAATDWQSRDLQHVTFFIASETTSGFFRVYGNELRINEDFFSEPVIVSKHQSATIRVQQENSNWNNITINLFMSKEKLDCSKVKRNICFWNGVSFQVMENQEATTLGSMSSKFYSKLCKNYSLKYQVVKGEEYVSVKNTNEEEGILSIKKKIKKSETPRIPFLVNCTLSNEKNSESFLKEFELYILEEKKLQIFFDILMDTSSNVIYKNEKIASGTIRCPEGRNLNLNISMKNDPKNYFNLKCGKKSDEIVGNNFFYFCEITSAKNIYLEIPYSVNITIEDTSLNPENPNRYYFQNISFQPLNSELGKQSLKLSKNLLEISVGDLNYPQTVDLSQSAVLGARVAEPSLKGFPQGIITRKKIAASKIKYQILNKGPFNVTETGGIIYVSNGNLLKNLVYRIKIEGINPNGSRFFTTVQINVKDKKFFHGHKICKVLKNDNLRPSCSEKKFQNECEKTCGIATGNLKRIQNEIIISGCSWRNNNEPKELSRLYSTCSPDLSTCPDRFCDSLESLFPKICPQDCTVKALGTAIPENLHGIASATGVCYCDEFQKCTCALTNDTESSKHINAVKASYMKQCGTICLLSIEGAAVILVCGIFAILFMLYRRRIKKRYLHQGPLKEDLVNINYEEYIERPGEIIRSSHNVTIKEIPEYYDKKWEFPRYRLTIEETLGEGEFGKVLKAKADGIAGHEGSTTVAVKTLKDNAKDSELGDLISEFQLLKEINHPNVIHLLGACTKLDGPVYIIIEYAKHGSLRNFLRKHRHLSYEHIGKEENSNETTSPKDILTFAWQIAKGMNYLTDMKLVHRDLAARNVLVAEGLICKISDFGLTRDIYEDDTYFKKSKGRVPVKWMAPESLADHIYTTKSDVWSYGIVLWELVTTGASPYPGIAAQDLCNLLKGGYRMEKPLNCSDEFYQILRCCWQENPSYRPTFKSLVAKLEEMLAEGKDYLDLNPRTAENKTYFSDFLNEDDEKESFLPREYPSNETQIFKTKFEMFEKPVKAQQYCKCQVEQCRCDLRYENENMKIKPKYENEVMKDMGYDQPAGEPKPVNTYFHSIQNFNYTINYKELPLADNLNVKGNKKELCDVKKI